MISFSRQFFLSYKPMLTLLPLWYIALHSENMAVVMINGNYKMQSTDRNFS